jgi:hypothetical protein
MFIQVYQRARPSVGESMVPFEYSAFVSMFTPLEDSLEIIECACQTCPEAKEAVKTTTTARIAEMFFLIYSPPVKAVFAGL